MPEGELTLGSSSQSVCEIDEWHDSCPNAINGRKPAVLFREYNATSYFQYELKVTEVQRLATGKSKVLGIAVICKAVNLVLQFGLHDIRYPIPQDTRLLLKTNHQSFWD